MPARRSDDGAHSSQMDPAELSQFTQSDKYKDEDLNNKAGDLVRFFLSAAGRRQTIKRQEITEKIMKDMPRAFPLVLERARAIMEDTFGLNIVEVEKPKKSFCVTNNLELDVAHVHLQWGDADNQLAALLMTVLSIIFMSGEVIQEDVLWRALERIDLGYGKVDNNTFGDVRKVITQEFVQQGYLIHKKQPDTDPPKCEFLWGPRAYVMTTKEDVLSFVCQIYGEMEMFDWPQQYDLIHGPGAAAKAKAESDQQSQG